MPKERPILFSGPMVQAILDGRKTQTRRIMKPQPISLDDSFGQAPCVGISNDRAAVQCNELCKVITCPYGKTGDRLWVRETFSMKRNDGAEYESPWYKSDADKYGLMGMDENGPVYIEHLIWKPSIHMPRHASRINLEITSIRVERLQDISESDAIAEGIEPTPGRDGHNDRWLFKNLRGSLSEYSSTAYPKDAYRSIWESINGATSWDANPWVWVIEFPRFKAVA